MWKRRRVRRFGRRRYKYYGKRRYFGRYVLTGGFGGGGGGGPRPTMKYNSPTPTPTPYIKEKKNYKPKINNWKAFDTGKKIISETGKVLGSELKKIGSEVKNSLVRILENSVIIPDDEIKGKTVKNWVDGRLISIPWSADKAINERWKRPKVPQIISVAYNSKDKYKELMGDYMHPRFFRKDEKRWIFKHPALSQSYTKKLMDKGTIRPLDLGRNTTKDLARRGEIYWELADTTGKPIYYPGPYTWGGAYEREWGNGMGTPVKDLEYWLLKEGFDMNRLMVLNLNGNLGFWSPKSKEKIIKITDNGILKFKNLDENELKTLQMYYKSINKNEVNSFANMILEATKSAGKIGVPWAETVANIMQIIKDVKDKNDNLEPVDFKEVNKMNWKQTNLAIKEFVKRKEQEIEAENQLRLYEQQQQEELKKQDEEYAQRQIEREAIGDGFEPRDPFDD